MKAKAAYITDKTGLIVARAILFTDDQLINEELNTEFRTFSNEYDVYNPLITLINLSEGNSLLNQYVAELRDVHVQNDRMRFRRNIERIG